MLLKELETETEILARIPGPQMETLLAPLLSPNS